jgi:hypothetical protein
MTVPYQLLIRTNVTPVVFNDIMYKTIVNRFYLHSFWENMPSHKPRLKESLKTLVTLCLHASLFPCLP